MQQGLYKVLLNEALTQNVFKMILSGDTKAIKGPGQFINIKLEGFFLRRPISICDYDEKTITIIYKVVGAGTLFMSKLTSGYELDCLVGLGNGYDTTSCKQKALVIGGGVGVPPLFALSKKLISEGKSVDVILGFNTENEVFYEREFKELGCCVKITTVDGSYGIKGFVTNAIDCSYDYFYTCGPEPMLKAVYGATNTSGEFSLEERMGCGFGACMGCSLQTKEGTKRVCKEGPVFKKEVLLWEK